MKIQWLVCLSMLCAFVLTAASRAEADAYSDAVLATGPVAYYRMSTDPAAAGDALVNEVSPGTLDGSWGWTDANPATVPISGLAGPSSLNGFVGLDAGNLAATYGGSGDPDGLPDQMDLPDFDNDLATVSFFMKAPADGNDSRIFSTSQAAVDTFRVIYGPAAGDDSQLVLVTESWGGQESVGAVVNDDAWHQVVMVRNGDATGTGAIYVDGVNAATLDNFNDGWGHDDITARIGARHGDSNPGWGGFEGGLDEFVYWDRALSSSEVAGLYTIGILPPTLGDMNVNGLVDFDDIAPFNLGLTNEAAYETAYGQLPVVNGDTDANGIFDFDDIAGFVDILGGSGVQAAVPEPSALVLAALGLLGLVGYGWRRGKLTS